ncbi:unnamed protein product [Brassica rapa subsp. trilocularis]
MMLDGRGYIGISVVLYLKERYAFLVFLFDREYCLRNGIQIRGNDGIGFPTIVVMHQGHCVDRGVFICVSVPLVSCDPLGFPKSVLLVLTISGDDGVADLSLDLSILRYVLFLNQMKVTGGICGEVSLALALHYDFNGFINTQDHMVLVDEG